MRRLLLGVGLLVLPVACDGDDGDDEDDAAGSDGPSASDGGSDDAAESDGGSDESGGGGGSASCPGDGDCVHAVGTFDGEPVDVTCGGGEIGFDPMGGGMVRAASCAMQMEHPYTINIQLWSPEMTGTFGVDSTTGTFSPDAGISEIIFQVTKGAGDQRAAGDCFNISTTLEITELTDTTVGGTINATWADAVITPSAAFGCAEGTERPPAMIEAAFYFTD